MRRRSEHQVLTIALFVAGVVYLAFPFATTAWTLAVLSFVLGLGLGSGQPMVMSLLHTHAPAGRIGEAVGVRMSLVQTMAVAVPLLFGALGTSLGLTPVFWSVRPLPRCRRLSFAPLAAARRQVAGRAFRRSTKFLRNLATFGATTTWQYGCRPLRTKYSWW